MRASSRTAAGTIAAAAALLTALSTGAGAAPNHAGGGGDLSVARAASARYHDVAAAEADGYGLPPSGPLHECIASLDPAHPGGMGYHYISGPAVSDAVLDPATPEVLVYERRQNGSMRLVAVEYVVFKEAWEAEHGPTVPHLFGRAMTEVPMPNRYELPGFYQIHVWLWKHNPAGLFADHNPRVSCPPAG
jgi:hypothetical protein